MQDVCCVQRTKLRVCLAAFHCCCVVLSQLKYLYPFLASLLITCRCLWFDECLKFGCAKSPNRGGDAFWRLLVLKHVGLN